MLKLKIYITFSLLIISICFVKSQQSICSLKVVEGIIIFDPQIGDYPMPQDIVLIPFVADKNISFEENIRKGLIGNLMSYFMYFQNIRHTQPSVFTRLDCLRENIDTSFCIVKSRLKPACEEMRTIEIDAVRFPGLGAAVDCKVKVSLGKIIFKEGEPYLNDAGSQIKRNQQHQFSLILNNQQIVMNYKNDSRYFGLAVSFLPIVLYSR